MRRVLIRALLVSSCGLFPAMAHAQAGTEAGCIALANVRIETATAVASRWVAADAAKSMPAYCEVTATLSPVAGSNIGVVYRLPENWNGKLLGLGGGGWAGNVTLAAATPGLKAGYATASTNGGHPSTSPWDTDWSSNPEALTDFAYRAINRMTVAGKAVVQSYYGRKQDKAYFQGCSTGGRMALMEAQRFPDDYDAIIARAPVYTLQVQTSGVLRSKLIKEAGGFSPAQLKLVNAAVLGACDAKDGLKDGLINDPARCGWSPKALICKAGQSGDSCLTHKQAATLETLYRGIKAPDGSYAMLPLSRGGETLWSAFITVDGTGVTQASGGGMPGLSRVLFGDRTVDFNHFTADKDVPEARNSAFGKAYEAGNPDLKRFVAHGGKLLLWHGESDPGPSPVATADYYQRALKATPGAANAVRLFMGPGVSHCGGGPGADSTDDLTVLDGWVTSGKAPETMIAVKNNTPMKRKLCPFPKVARFDGKGDVNDPAAWSCEAPKG
ncbi:MAG: tannase/feruloyl esterase family alpha/beta hydrolase [Sphingobium sp.]|nr:tannase/feruloyl esterase family alpha/beta hydrolase [Sphingobium sp.]